MAKGRIISLPLKDANEQSLNAHDIPWGTGTSDIRGTLAESKRQHFDGNTSVERKYTWKDNVIDVAQCTGFCVVSAPEPNMRQHLVSTSLSANILI